MITTAATVGSPQNPLITQSYLRGQFTDSLRQSATASLESASDTAFARLHEIYISRAGYSFAPSFMPVELSAGQTVRLVMGSSFVHISGNASVGFSGGAVINISTGQEVTNGASLQLMHRYFIAEDTIAVVTAHSAVTGYIDGFYLTDGTLDAPITPPPPPPTDTTPPQALPFRDVGQTDWFFNAVEFVFSNGFFAGTAADTFSPGSHMTRAMFVTVLHRLEGLPPISGQSVFTDVQDPTRFYYDAVKWANANGIVSGIGGGRFAPDASVTREQMAAIMHRYAEFKGYNLTSMPTAIDGFPDAASVSGFAVEPMRWAVTQSVLQGSDGSLLPLNTATRAQVAQIIYNFSSNVIGSASASTQLSGETADDDDITGETFD